MTVFAVSKHSHAIASEVYTTIAGLKFGSSQWLNILFQDKQIFFQRLWDSEKATTEMQCLNRNIPK